MAQNQSRRKVLKTAMTVPVATLLGGCQTKPPGTPAIPQPKKGPPRNKKRHPRSDIKAHPLPKFPRQAAGPQDVIARVEWDFERLVKEILCRLKGDKTDTEVDRFARTLPQDVTDQAFPGVRNLNVLVESCVEFLHETREGTEYVTGVIIQGCMARYTGRPGYPPADAAYPFKKGSTCADAQKEAGIDSPNALHDHLVYRSSSSSSSWGIP